MVYMNKLLVYQHNINNNFSIALVCYLYLNKNISNHSLGFNKEMFDGSHLGRLEWIVGDIE